MNTRSFIVITEEPSLIEITVSGKLDREDYEQFVPVVESLLDEHNDVRMLVQLIDFEGWSAGALWEDVKFNLAHFRDIERLAIVGDKKWEHGMAVFCKPFTTAEVRYFTPDHLEEARRWAQS